MSDVLSYAVAKFRLLLSLGESPSFDRCLAESFAIHYPGEAPTPDTRLLDDVLALQHMHRKTWRDKSERFWFGGLLEEVIELGLSLAGLHKHPPGRELRQIAAICLNWLEMRSGKSKS